MKLFAWLRHLFRASPRSRPSATLSPSDGERDGVRGVSENSFGSRIKTALVIWVWNHTPSCAEISRLTSRALEQPLTLKLRLKMRLHFVICAWCRRYFEQINFLHTHAPRLGMTMAELPGRGLSADAKTRIKTEVRKNLTLAL